MPSQLSHSDHAFVQALGFFLFFYFWCIRQVFNHSKRYKLPNLDKLFPILRFHTGMKKIRKGNTIFGEVISFLSIIHLSTDKYEAGALGLRTLT